MRLPQTTMSPPPLFFEPSHLLGRAAADDPCVAPAAPRRVVERAREDDLGRRVERVGDELGLRRLLGPVLREHPVRVGAEEDRVDARDEVELIARGLAVHGVDARRLADEVELSVRSRGEPVQRHELLHDHPAHVQGPFPTGLR